MTRRSAPRPLPQPALALASAVLLIIAFPSFNQPWAAWIALVPWLALLRRAASPREAFRWSWLIGGAFFLGSMWWMVHLTAFGGALAILGWVALSAYLALFFGLFGLGAHAFSARYAKRDTLVVLVVLPALWTALEFLRSHALSGLGWNLLGYSQTPWTEVIQLAAATGAWGVSCAIVLVNGLLARACEPAARPAMRLRDAGMACAVVAAMWLNGLQVTPQTVPVALVAVAQGNIPQEQKWDEAFTEKILRRYEALTRTAAAARPDLIVWPETSVPGYFDVEEELTQRILSLAREAQRPLLVGSPVPSWTAWGFRFFNRAVLVGADGMILQRYDKLRLVPYGEFIPGDQWLPWLRKLLPPIGDFIPGKEHTVFETPRLKFGVLICFEDIFPELAREFVRRGAQALVVITNDAWFGPTAAAYQHAQASAFRAVELGVPVVRAANTGWSGCIDRRGRWHDAVHNASGRELFVEGVTACGVRLEEGETLYRRWGDWFAWGCLLAALAAILPAIITASRSRRSVRGSQRPD